MHRSYTVMHIQTRLGLDKNWPLNVLLLFRIYKCKGYVNFIMLSQSLFSNLSACYLHVYAYVY